MRIEQLVHSKAGKFILILETLSVEAHSIITDERPVIAQMVSDAADRINNYLEAKYETDDRAAHRSRPPTA